MARQSGPRSMRNFRYLACHDLGRGATGGEGMGLHLGKRGRRTLFLAGAWAPRDITAVDVTDPRRPVTIFAQDLPHPDMRSNNLAICGDIMAVTRQATKLGLKPAGVEFFDISVPAEPRPVGFFDASGPTSLGTHFVWFTDGEYAYISSGLPDFEPRFHYDHFIPVILDVRDPANPKEAGRWWLPGSRAGDPEPALPRPAELLADSMNLERPAERAIRTEVGGVTVWDFGYRSHNIGVYPNLPDRAYVGLISGGVVTLDISDKANPTLVSRLQYSPPLPGYTHTVVPLGDEGHVLAITDECVVDGALDYPKLLWLADNRYEPRPVMIGSAPIPEDARGGGKARFGAHNLHENIPVAGSWRSDRYLVGTYFSAGLRVFDAVDPFHPREVAHFVPYAEGSPAGCTQLNDVFVDDRQIAYTVDRVLPDLHILELAL